MANFTASFDFDDSGDYNFLNTVLDAGALRLNTFSQTGLTFTEAFAADTGFTYNAALAEFTAGLVRTKDQTPAAAILGATYTSTIDASWVKSGSVTAALNGTPVLAAGKLVCDGVHGVIYTQNLLPIGAMRVRYTAGYTGAPALSLSIMGVRDASGSNNRIQLAHVNTGSTLRLTLVNATGTSIYNAIAIGGAWNPVDGTEYEIELNWDNVLGVVRVFINGVLHGTLSPGAWTFASTSGRYTVGANTSGYNLADASFNDVEIFNAVQHTAGYTPGYTVQETLYSESKIDLPNFTHLGPGAAQAFTNLTLTEVGSPRYIVEGQYWTGSAWAASAGTYAQASPLATVVANLPTLSVLGETVFSISVVFPSTNTLTSVDALTLTYSGSRYYSSGTCVTVLELEAEELLTFLATTEVTPVGTTLKYGLLKDGVLYYTTGGNVWAASNGTMAQLNTAAEINTNITGLLSGTNASILLHVRMETTDPLVTPMVAQLDLTYTFGAVGAAPATCLIHGYVRNIAGEAIEGAVVTFSLVRDSTSQYTEGGSNIIGASVETTTDDDLDPGYFEQLLVRSSEYEGSTVQKYKVTVVKESTNLRITQDAQGNDLEFEVPDAATRDITALITVS